jgi:hypothetical protein
MGLVARKETRINAYRNLWEKAKKRDQFEDLSIVYMLG